MSQNLILKELISIYKSGSSRPLYVLKNILNMFEETKHNRFKSQDKEGQGGHDQNVSETSF